jgi:hypothetical protein
MKNGESEMRSTLNASQIRFAVQNILTTNFSAFVTCNVASGLDYSEAKGSDILSDRQSALDCFANPQSTNLEKALAQARIAATAVEIEAREKRNFANYHFGRFLIARVKRNRSEETISYKKLHTFAFGILKQKWLISIL